VCLGLVEVQNVVSGDSVDVGFFLSKAEESVGTSVSVVVEIRDVSDSV
jgi:hypothetical protein